MNDSMSQTKCASGFLPERQKEGEKKQGRKRELGREGGREGEQVRVCVCV